MTLRGLIRGPLNHEVAMTIRRILGFVGVGLLVGAAFVYAETYVAGDVAGVWTAAGNPYIVEANIYVGGDKTLRIQEGVEVYFQDYDSLSVYGRLIVQGSPLDSVIFAPLPTNDQGWRGIFFFDDAMNDGDISYAVIRGSRTGVSISHCNVGVRNSTITSKAFGLVLIYTHGVYQNNTIHCDYYLTCCMGESSHRCTGLAIIAPEFYGLKLRSFFL